MPELTWAGKYDANGELAAPPRVKLPFQTVETVNQSAQQRQMALAAAGSGQDAEWRNRLIWGDKKYVLPSLLAEFAGRVDLIYIDPPFATGADFSFKTQIHSADSIVAPDATPQPRNPATPQPRNPATPQPRNPATPQALGWSWNTSPI